MTVSSPNGSALSLSMSEFNARAKKIAASTDAVGKGAPRRPASPRYQRKPAAADTKPADS